MSRFTAEEELVHLATGFRAVADHLYREFLQDRRKTSLLIRVETYRMAADQTDDALRRVRQGTQGT